MVKVYQRNAKYYETDQMGIIHHSNYIRWFEEARIDFLKQVDLDYKKLEAIGLSSPVLEVQVKYIKMVHFDDDVIIECKIVDYKGVRFSVEYIVKDASSNEIMTTGLTKHCFIDSEGRPVNLKKHYPDIHEKLINIM